MTKNRKIYEICEYKRHTGATFTNFSGFVDSYTTDRVLHLAKFAQEDEKLLGLPGVRFPEFSVPRSGKKWYGSPLPPRRVWWGSYFARR